MYYCQTRYYVPEWGRWLNPDNPNFLEFDNINGMNLFAYCGNNPVMVVDPNGTSAPWWYWAISIGGAVASIALTVVTAGVGTAIAGTVAGAVVGGFFGAVNAIKNDQDIVQGIGIGIINGVAMANTAASAAFSMSQGLLLGNYSMITNGFQLAVAGGLVGGGLAELGNQLANSQNIDPNSIINSAFRNAFFNGISAGIGSFGELYGLNIIESGIFSYISSLFIETTNIIIDIFKKLHNTF